MSSQGMLLASCCCAPQPFLCEDWQACLPRRAMLNMNYLEILEEIVGGTPRTVYTTSKSISCELEAVEDPFGRRLSLRSLPGGSGSYFQEALFYEVARGGSDGTDPRCSLPCGTPYLCRRDATQLSTQNGILTVDVRCRNPCFTGFGIQGNAYTNIDAFIEGTASSTTTFSNDGICSNTGTSGSSEAYAAIGMNVFDVNARCVADFGDYVLTGETGLDAGFFGIAACNPQQIGFVCDPFVNGNVLSASPAMSFMRESCPEIVCEDFICTTPDPSDPFSFIITLECGCENLFPGSYSNSAGERIRTYRRNVQSNVTLTVTEP